MQEQKTALLVIDAQIGPLWGTYKKEETLSVIQHIIAKAEKASITIIYIQHEELPGGMLAKGSPFWQFTPEISPRPEDFVIPKQAADAFYQTTLTDELQKREINHLVVTGVRTEYCIDTTCRAAITRGFHVTLVEDGHTSADAVIPAETIIQHHNHTLRTIGTPDRSIHVLPADQIVF
ncbi:isochorismatase family protein [Aneurinibacillus uraniidurans]|uniref:isochorismatase family protein n=1 Tax=Aneurinibacillus uraniidurans TaxID=2966586 RepID=UPI002349D358|nr:isochorismatase family protein [Aneurinibacillus sp. B1]WCN36543.1 isochorismatase family protein [Aneurinibacillus sp. B1]